MKSAQSFIETTELENLLQQLLHKAGASQDTARLIAHNCMMCERDGTLSHGVFRIPGYISALKNGWANGHANPKITGSGTPYIRVDAGSGFSQVALESARSTIISSLGESGLALVAIRDSLHFSALWPDLENFVENGFLALTMVTGGPAVIPPGAHRKIYGTNPIAFGTPNPGNLPLIFDMATSVISQGDLQLIRDSGDTLPRGIGVGRQGRETQEPAEILNEGGLLPFGGHKGAAISLMIEILASGLTGGAFSYERDRAVHAENEPRKTGQVIILIDPTWKDNNGYNERIKYFIQELVDAGVDRLPGDRRYKTRRNAESFGIPVTKNIEAIVELSKSL